MCSLPCSSSQTQHQSSCSSSFSSVSQDGCTQTVPEGQRIRQFNEPLTSPQSHDARHPVFLSELTGEPWPAFWSSETLVVKEPIRSWDPSLSWSEQSTCRRMRGHVTAIKLIVDLKQVASNWWNLQRSFKVTGAERLKRNTELLPGGIQIVLHHLYKHKPSLSWHEHYLQSSNNMLRELNLISGVWDHKKTLFWIISLLIWR